MLLKNFVENIEKLASAPIVRNDPAKFYKRLCDMAGRFLSQSSVRLTTKLHALTALTFVYANIRRSHGQMLMSSEADNLRKYIFLEIAKLVIGVDFLQLEDDNLTKRLFKKTIVDTKNMLQSFSDHRYFDALDNGMQAEWSHATLLSILRDDDLNLETVQNYIKNFEHEDIMHLRIEALLESDCEDLAQNLMKHCLVCDVFVNDVEILIRRLQFLHRHGNIEEIHQLCSKVSSATACEVLSKAVQSDSSSAVSLLLSQTFFLLDWVQPVDLARTKFLMKSWMELESKIGLKQELQQGFDKVLALTNNSKQLIIFLEVTEELFGLKFGNLCSSLALNALRQERHQFVCAHLYTKDLEVSESAKRSLSEICFILMRLYRKHPQMNVCCLLSWHYLHPTESGYFMIEKYFSNVDGSLFTSELSPPPCVSSDIYVRLYHAVELLRHDVLKVSLLWAELKPLLLSNMNRAGFRYVMTSNHFIRYQPKNQAVFNVLCSQQKNTKSSNTVESRAVQESKMCKKVPSLPLDANSSKAARIQKPAIQVHPKETEVQGVAASTDCNNSINIESTVSGTSNSCQDNIPAGMLEPILCAGKIIVDGNKSEMNGCNTNDLQDLADSKSSTSELRLGTSDSLSSEVRASELIEDAQTDGKKESKEVDDHNLTEPHVISSCDVTDTEQSVVAQSTERVTEQQIESSSEKKSSDIEGQNKQSQLRSSLQQSGNNSSETNARNRPCYSEFDISSKATNPSDSPPQVDDANPTRLTEPTGNSSKDTMSLAVYDINGSSKSSSELLFVVTHSESIQPGHLDKINDNNNQVFAVSVKHSVESVWSEDVHGYDSCGTQLVSTRLVSSVQPRKNPAVAIDYSKETSSEETLEMSVNIPGKEIFVSQSNVDMLPMVGAEVLLPNTKPISFDSEVTSPSSAFDTKSTSMVAIGDSLGSDVIEEKFVSDEPLSHFDVKELDINVEDGIAVSEPSCPLAAHETGPADVLSSGDTDSIVTRGTLMVVHPIVNIDEPFLAVILKSDAVKSNAQCLETICTVSESKPVVDIHDVESVANSLTTVAPTSVQTGNTSSASCDMSGIKLPCIKPSEMNSSENKLKIDPSDNQQCLLTVVAESVACAVDDNLANILIANEPSTDELLKEDKLHLVEVNSQSEECSSVLHTEDKYVREDCDILHNGEEQKRGSQRIEEDIATENKPALIIKTICNEEVNLDPCQEEIVPFTDHLTTIERDLAPEAKLKICRTDKDDLTEESLHISNADDCLVCESLSTDDLAPYSDERSSSMPVATENIESGQKNCGSSCAYASSSYNDEPHSLGIAERSPWQAMFCPTIPPFARHLENLAQRSLDFDRYSTLSAKTLNLPIAVVRTEQGEHLPVYSHDYSYLLPAFPELLSLSYSPSSVSDNISSEPSSQAAFSKQAEIVSKQCSIENPMSNDSFALHNRKEKDVGQMQSKSLAKRSQMEYRCHICDKVLNSSKGHRLHAIRVHEVDCVDLLCPAKGYTCRKCSKLIALSRITNLRTRVRSKFCTCQSRIRKLEQLKDSKAETSVKSHNIHGDVNSVRQSVGNVTSCITSSVNRRRCTTSDNCTSSVYATEDTFKTDASADSGKIQSTTDDMGINAADTSLIADTKSDTIFELEVSCDETDGKNGQVLKSDHENSLYSLNSATGDALAESITGSYSDLCNASTEIDSCSINAVHNQQQMVLENSFNSDLVNDHRKDSNQSMNSDAVHYQAVDNKDQNFDMHTKDQDGDQKQNDQCPLIPDKNQCPAESDNNQNQTLKSESGHRMTGQEECISKQDDTVKDHCLDESESARQYGDLADFNNCLKSSSQDMLDEKELIPKATENKTTLVVDFQHDIAASGGSMVCTNVNSVKDCKKIKTDENKLLEDLDGNNEESLSAASDIQLPRENTIQISNCSDNSSSDRSQELDVNAESDEPFPKLITNADITRKSTATSSNITESTSIGEKIESRALQGVTSTDDINIQDARHEAAADVICGDSLNEIAQNAEYTVAEHLNKDNWKITEDTKNDRCTVKSETGSTQETGNACLGDSTLITHTTHTVSSEYTAAIPACVSQFSILLHTEASTLCTKSSSETANDGTLVVNCVAAISGATESYANSNDAVNKLDCQPSSADFNSDDTRPANNPSSERNSASSEQSLLSTVIKLTVSKKQNPISHKIPVKPIGFSAGSGTPIFSNSTPLCKLIAGSSMISLQGSNVQVLQTQVQSTVNVRLDGSGSRTCQPALPENVPVSMALSDQLAMKKDETLEKVKKVEMPHTIESVVLSRSTESNSEHQRQKECKSEASGKITNPYPSGTDSNAHARPVPEVKKLLRSCNLVKDYSRNKALACTKCGELLPSYSCWKVHVKSCRVSSLMPTFQAESLVPETSRAKMKRRSSGNSTSSDPTHGKKPKVATKREQTTPKPSPQSSSRPQSSDVDDFSPARVRFEGKTYSRMKDKSGTL